MVEKGFGTFKGVFLPSVLTILGVIMFLRMGWIVGHAGIVGTITIVCLSSLITILTGLSISAMATNMKVGGGGVYFMISRSLGLSTGTAVGVPLYFAQTVGIAFYLAGFSETVQFFFPDWPVFAISAVTLVLLTAIAYLSSNLALKIQLIIFLILAFALYSFFAGTPTETELNFMKGTENKPFIKEGFWSIFAVFFPAVTGIEAGLAMSGSLKNPARSLPLGTLAAVLVGLIVYLSISIILVGRATPYTLAHDFSYMFSTAKYEAVIYLGVFGASLSSALGALLGAPRTLQALAKDRVLPTFLIDNQSKEKTPRKATIITFIFALAAVMLGDLNAIAPILSMFFLTSYGMVNLASGLENLIGSPSWRPQFKIPHLISFLGAFSCFAAMFMINAGATIICLIIISLVYYFTQRRELISYFGDIRRGILIYLTRFSVHRLSKLSINTKSWRPNIIVFSGAPSKRWFLIALGDAIANNRSFLTVATLLSEEHILESRIASTEKNIQDYLEKRNVEALVRVSAANNIQQGVVSVVRDYGLGGVFPNTVIMGTKTSEDEYEDFARTIIKLYEQKRNIMLVRNTTEGAGIEALDLNNSLETSGPKKIHIWWGLERRNAGFSLAISHLLRYNRNWSKMDLCLKSIVTEEKEVEAAQQVLKKMLNEARIDASSSVILHEGGKEELFAKIKEESKDAHLTFLGMLPPNLEGLAADPEATIKNYVKYYKLMLEMTEGFPPVVVILASEQIDFHKIFNSDLT